MYSSAGRFAASWKACAIARAFPLYTRKKPSSAPEGSIKVSFWTKDGPLPSSAYPRLRTAADGVRNAARLVDMPPEQLPTTAFTAEALAAVERLEFAGFKVDAEVIAGEELRDRGYGGLWGVGKAAEEPPADVDPGPVGKVTPP